MKAFGKQLAVACINSFSRFMTTYLLTYFIRYKTKSERVFETYTINDWVLTTSRYQFRYLQHFRLNANNIKLYVFYKFSYKLQQTLNIVRLDDVF